MAQTRPSPSEIFEADAELEVRRGSDTYRGRGFWRVDQPEGKGRERYDFDIQNQHMDYDFLQRYDTGKSYEITGHPPKCNSTAVTGKFPSAWSWLAQATYKGNQTVDGKALQVWSLNVAGATSSLGVQASAVNTPVLFESKSATQTVRIIFRSWRTSKPHPSWFDVPSICTSKF